ncbi:metalloprotease mig-17-like [Amblyomma americanum]
MSSKCRGPFEGVNFQEVITSAAVIPAISMADLGDDLQEDLQEEEHSTSGQTEENRPEIFHVEVCFVTTQKYRRAFGDFVQLSAYFGAMMNSVKLRYEGMTTPRIDFLLKALTVRHGTPVRFLMDELCFFCPYMEGAAATGSVCKSGRVGIVQDTPHSYNAAKTLAHELAHILGASHDDSRPVRSPSKNSGATTCPASEGYLMGRGKLLGLRKYSLSNCSIRQIQQHYRKLPMSCINVTSEAYEKTTDYPGKNITAHQLCRFTLGEEWQPYDLLNIPEKRTEYINCQVKCCSLKKNSCITLPLLDGMTCSDNKTCRKAVCTDKNWESSTSPAAASARNL